MLVVGVSGGSLRWGCTQPPDRSPTQLDLDSPSKKKVIGAKEAKQAKTSYSDIDWEATTAINDQTVSL